MIPSIDIKIRAKSVFLFRLQDLRYHFFPGRTDGWSDEPMGLQTDGPMDEPMNRQNAKQTDRRTFLTDVYEKYKNWKRINKEFSVWKSTLTHLYLIISLFIKCLLSPVHQITPIGISPFNQTILISIKLERRWNNCSSREDKTRLFVERRRGGHPASRRGFFICIPRL